MAAVRLLVIAPRELTRDPRARRAAIAARERGLEVTGLCGGGDPPISLEGVPVARTRTPEVGHALRQLGLGGMKKERPLVRELRGIYRLGRLALATVRLVRTARPLGRFDVVHANDLDTLPAGWLLARRAGARLVYDAHELYSMQEPDPPRLYRAITTALERALGRRADAVVTVADVIADELVRLLRLHRRPYVVLNCPAVVEVPEPVPNPPPLRVVYQSSVGPGRPLGDLFAAAELCDAVSFTLRLAHADLAALEDDVRARNLESRITVRDPVAPDRLVEALAGYDVGLIINRPDTRNDELVLPNKLFEYLMAGVAVVAPRLPALGEVVDGAGLLFDPGSPASLADALGRLAADPATLFRLRAHAYALARERYNAAAQETGYVAAWGLSPLAEAAPAPSRGSGSGAEPA